MEKIIKNIKTRFGSPIFNVELTDESIIYAYEEAKEEYDMYLNIYHDSCPFNIRLNKDVWVKKYTLAICKEILGRIRGQYSGKLEVGGSEYKMDYESLLLESLKEKEILINIFKK